MAEDDGIIQGFLQQPPVEEPDAPRDYMVLVGEPMDWDEHLAELDDEDEQPEHDGVDSGDEQTATLKAPSHRRIL